MEQQQQQHMLQPPPPSPQASLQQLWLQCMGMRGAATAHSLDEYTPPGCFDEQCCFCVPRDEGETGEQPCKRAKMSKTKTRVLAIDCEMVCTETNPKALARLSIVDHNGAVLFDEFIRPQQPVTRYMTRFSGVTAADLKTARTWHACREEVKAILRGAVVVGHHVIHDFHAMGLHPLTIGCTVWDTSEVAELRTAAGLDVATRPSLATLTKKILGYVIQQPANDMGHNSVEDAKATMHLYRLFAHSATYSPPLWSLNLWSIHRGCTKTLAYSQEPERREAWLCSPTLGAEQALASECALNGWRYGFNDRTKTITVNLDARKKRLSVKLQSPLPLAEPHGDDWREKGCHAMLQRLFRAGCLHHEFFHAYTQQLPDAVCVGERMFLPQEARNRILAHCRIAAARSSLWPRALQNLCQGAGLSIQFSLSEPATTPCQCTVSIEGSAIPVSGSGEGATKKLAKRAASGEAVLMLFALGVVDVSDLAAALDRQLSLYTADEALAKLKGVLGCALSKRIINHHFHQS